MGPAPVVPQAGFKRFPAFHASSVFHVFHAIAIQLPVDFGLRSLAILGSFGGVILGFSEEARTRGFPSPPFGGFGFVVVTT